MKAKEIITAMQYDSALAERSNTWTYDEGRTETEWIDSTFGNFVVVNGALTPGDYMAVWSVDGNEIYPFQNNNVPDVTLRRVRAWDYDEDDREVWLWRVE